MAKATNLVLAEKISTRIDDILEETGFTLLGLAVFTGIGQSAIKSYHRKTIPISVETVEKICAPLSISLVAFFDFRTKIILSQSAIKAITKFKDAEDDNISEYFVGEESNFIPKLKSSKSKWEIEMMNYIIHHTQFFKEARTTADIQSHLAVSYSMSLTPDRIYKLLIKHINTSLHQGQTNRINQDGSESIQMIATYIRI